MADSDIVIVNAGLVSPTGLSLAETACAARARVARLREIDWRDRRFQPYVVGCVPDDGLPPLNENTARLPLTYREARMLRLAHAALEEALLPLGASAEPVPLLLGLPEYQTTRVLQERAFVQHLGLQVPGRLDTGTSLAAARGRAAGLMALREAMARLARGDSLFVLVGGVDCLVDLHVLAQLDLQGRIRNDVNSDGFSPSEGAAFLLLSLASTARERSLRPLARVLAAANGHEEGHLHADVPYRGEGLAGTLSSLLSQPAVSQAGAPIGSVFCSFNGERIWAREFGVARLRQAQAFAPDHQMEHPAECFGDLGAAHGPALAALAAHAVHHGYRSPPSLVYASSDHGSRAAALLARVA